MASISTADLRKFIAERQREEKDDQGDIIKRPASNAEINRELAIIKRAFRLAQQAGKLVYRPHVPLLEERNVRQGFFERAAFEDVRGRLPEELRGIVTFAYYAGWRIPSEVLTLQWSQIDRKAKTVRLEPGTSKNAEGRTLPYGQLHELDEVIEARWT